MKIKIDPQALQERLKQEEEMVKNRSSEPRASDILRGEKAGVVNFRASYYVHNKDIEKNPFLERYYHYGVPGGTCYCPKENEGKECHICNVVWKQCVKYKGMREEGKPWQKLLPRKNIFIPGIVRGKEDEGWKFLRIGTRKDRMSDNHKQIYGWFFKNSTCDWLDPDEGFDMEITYSELDEARSRHLGGAKFALERVDLSRDPSKFGKKGEFEKRLDSMKNIDEEIFPVKTTEDTLLIIEEVLKKMDTEDEMEFPSKNGVTETPVDDVTKKINRELGLGD